MTRIDDAARKITHASGSTTAVLASIVIIVAWLAGGAVFGFSEFYQMIINTATTVITFIMVFAIQNSQNRDTEAIQAKLDELVAATQGARNELVGIEKRESANGVEKQRLTQEECDDGEEVK